MTTKSTWTKEQRDRLLTIIETSAVVLLALVACAVLEIKADRLAEVPLTQWTLIAGTVAGAIVAIRNAFRGDVRTPTNGRSEAPKEEP